MIYVYKSLPSNTNLIVDGEREFKASTYSCVLQNSELIHLVERVEGAEHIEGKLFRSKFGSTFSLIEISTGCKILLNILVNDRSVHSVEECGRNIFDFLYEQNTGRIYSTYLPYCRNRKQLLIGVSSTEVTEPMSADDIERWLEYE